MNHLFIFCLIILLTGCFKDITNSAEEVAKFEQEHQEYLDGIKEMSEKVLSDQFDFKGIEVIYVQAGEAYYQWLGHVLIRFVGSGSESTKDFGVSFIADFNDYNLDNLKAYYGGYKVLPIIDTWDNYIRDYVVKEKRYMNRYIFPINNENKEKIKSTLRDWIVNPENAGPYSFRRNSCTALLLKLLAAGDPEVNGNEIAFPVEVVPYLKKIEKISYSYGQLNFKNYKERSNELLPIEKYER